MSRLSYLAAIDQSSYISSSRSYQRKVQTQIMSKCTFCNNPLSHSKWRMKVQVQRLNEGLKDGDIPPFSRCVHNECMHYAIKNRRGSIGRYGE